MLEDGNAINDVFIWNNDYVTLSQNGDQTMLYYLKPDQSGLHRVVESEVIPAATRVQALDQKHLILSAHQHINLLSEGSDITLQPHHVIDARDGRNIEGDGVHRIMTVDMNKDGIDELLMFDDILHECHAYVREDNTWKPLYSWQMFSDEAYPYGYMNEEALRGEPRMITALEMNGDGYPELALLAHDRLIVYLSKVTSDQQSVQGGE